MKNLNKLVSDIKNAEKIDDWEAQHNAFCALSNYVAQCEIEQFNKGYDMGVRHTKTGKVESLSDAALKAIADNGGYKTQPIARCDT